LIGIQILWSNTIHLYVHTQWQILSEKTNYVHFAHSTQNIFIGMYLQLISIGIYMIKECKLLNSHLIMLNQIIPSGCENAHPAPPTYLS